MGSLADYIWIDPTQIWIELEIKHSTSLNLKHIKLSIILPNAWKCLRIQALKITIFLFYSCFQMNILVYKLISYYQVKRTVTLSH